MMFAFKNSIISSMPSPIDFSAGGASTISYWKESLRYKITRIIIQYIIESIEPEMKGTPFMDRMLIGIGKNTCEE